VNIGGTINQNGNYGEMYNSTSASLTLTTINVWYNITDFITGELSGWSVTDNSYLTSNDDGLYKITYNIIATVSANNELDYQILNNGIPISKSLSRVRYASAQYLPLSFTFFSRIVDGDNISIQVRNADSSGRIMSIDNRLVIVDEVGR
jgi:hypothetical protein